MVAPPPRSKIMIKGLCGDSSRRVISRDVRGCPSSVCPPPPPAQFHISALPEPRTPLNTRPPNPYQHSYTLKFPAHARESGSHAKRKEEDTQEKKLEGKKENQGRRLKPREEPTDGKAKKTTRDANTVQTSERTRGRQNQSRNHRNLNPFTNPRPGLPHPCQALGDASSRSCLPIHIACSLRNPVAPTRS